MAKVTLQQDGDVAVVTLSNPPLNLVVPEVVDDLEAIGKELSGMPVRALLLRADGENFSAGADVAQMFQGRSAADARVLLSRFNTLLSVYERLPFPTLAAVQGMCLAAGLEMVLACDMAWAGASAQLGLVEAVIGTVPLGGGAHRLAQKAGAARAYEMVMTAGMYDAGTCERWNIINRVVPDADLADKAFAFARRLAAGPTRAHATTKGMMREYLDHGIRAADDMIPDLAAPLFESEDMRAGIESLLEHGPGKAKFSGR